MYTDKNITSVSQSKDLFFKSVLHCILPSSSGCIRSTVCICIRTSCHRNAITCISTGILATRTFHGFKLLGRLFSDILQIQILIGHLLSGTLKNGSFGLFYSGFFLEITFCEFFWFAWFEVNYIALQWWVPAILIAPECELSETDRNKDGIPISVSIIYHLTCLHEINTSWIT